MPFGCKICARIKIFRFDANIQKIQVTSDRIFLALTTHTSITHYVNDGDQTRQVSKRVYAAVWSTILFLGYGLPVIMWKLFVGDEPSCDLFVTTRFFAIALFAPYTAMVTILICVKFLWKSKFKSVSEGVVWFLNISPSWLKSTNWISLCLSIVLLLVIATCPLSEYVILGFSIPFAVFIGSFFVIASMWWSKKTDDNIHGKLDSILDALTDPDPSDPTKRINKLDKIEEILKEIRDSLKRER